MLLAKTNEFVANRCWSGAVVLDVGAKLAKYVETLPLGGDRNSIVSRTVLRAMKQVEEREKVSTETVTTSGEGKSRWEECNNALVNLLPHHLSELPRNDLPMFDMFFRCFSSCVVDVLSPAEEKLRKEKENALRQQIKDLLSSVEKPSVSSEPAEPQEPVPAEPVVLSEPVEPQEPVPAVPSVFSEPVEPQEPVVLSEPAVPLPSPVEIASLPMKQPQEPSEPAVAEPAVAEPVPAEPAVAEPVPAESVPAEPVPAEPAVAEPVVAEPVVLSEQTRSKSSKKRRS